MGHTVWNLGSIIASGRHQPRIFVAGVEPGQAVRIGRSREPKNMLLILDAWLQVNDFELTTDEYSQALISLALGKDPLNTALLLPVGRAYGAGTGTANESRRYTNIEHLFRAQGTMWAAKQVAIDVAEAGALQISDIDVHMDWTVVTTDWFTWFVSWNDLEAPPDGSLVDGERAYA